MLPEIFRGYLNFNQTYPEPYVIIFKQNRLQRDSKYFLPHALFLLLAARRRRGLRDLRATDV